MNKPIKRKVFLTALNVLQEFILINDCFAKNASHLKFARDALNEILRLSDSIAVDQFEMHYGPPPHEGFWCVSNCGSDWRFWNADFGWSALMVEQTKLELVIWRAQKEVCIPSRSITQIQWCHYWPENARVPRIDPRSVV